MRRFLLASVTLAAVIGAPLLLVAIGPQGRTSLHSRFMDAEPPPAPNYAEPATWAALPTKEDAADRALAPGTSDQQATALAVCGGGPVRIVEILGPMRGIPARRTRGCAFVLT